MVNEAEQRIAERNAIADERYEQQNALGRGMNRAGLATSNTLDHAHAPLESHKGAFLGGALIGVVAGAGLGIAAWIALMAFPPTAALVAGGTGLLALMGIGAAGMALYEGKSAVKRHMATHGQTHVSDHVAEAFGTVGKGQSQTLDQFQQADHFRWQEREHQRRLARQHHHHHNEFF